MSFTDLFYYCLKHQNFRCCKTTTVVLTYNKKANNKVRIKNNNVCLKFFLTVLLTFLKHKSFV